MLYVSRYIGLDRFAVYDTDDDTEEVCWASDLDGVVGGLVKIEGVTVDWRDYTNMDVPYYVSYISSLETYQPESSLSSLQLKTRLLCGVDIITFKEYITGITVHPERIKHPCSIRLSDFGSCVADCVLRMNIHNFLSGYHVTTLILDDKLDFERYAFIIPLSDNTGVHGFGIKYDIREMTDFRKVRTVYEFFSRLTEEEKEGSIIDIPSRKRAFVR